MGLQVSLVLAVALQLCVPDGEADWLAVLVYDRVGVGVMCCVPVGVALTEAVQERVRDNVSVGDALSVVPVGEELPVSDSKEEMVTVGVAECEAEGVDVGIEEVGVQVVMVLLSETECPDGDCVSVGDRLSVAVDWLRVPKVLVRVGLPVGVQLRLPDGERVRAAVGLGEALLLSEHVGVGPVEERVAVGPLAEAVEKLGDGDPELLIERAEGVGEPVW